jgi:hypothetical protein
MSDQNQVESLIQGYQRIDPRLYDILRFLASQIESLRTVINLSLTPETVAAEDPTLALPASFTYTLPGASVNLAWSASDINGNILSAVSSFEVRKGTDWATASFVVRTSSLSAILAPDLLTGEHTYLLKTINSSGSYSTSYLTLVVNISPIFLVSLTSTVVDNNILLYWTEPATHSFNITRYEVFREGVSLGFKYGTFMATFENVGGTFEYGVVAYDLAGNSSLMYTIDITVSAPPDFELISNILSTFSGTKSHCVVDSGKLVAATANDTWQSHFATLGWNTPQDQINAGYPIYLQPSWVE